MATVTPRTPRIKYPSSDGEPMAETPIHRQTMADLIANLQDYYADEPNVYVSGNMMMYYVEGNADKSVSPDVFVTLGIPKLPERDVYKIWLEGKGPDAVIEVTSKSTARVDQRWKFDLYRDVLKVREYILFDPREQTLAGTNLCAYRRVKGEYDLIPKIRGRVVSQVLGLELKAAGPHLRLDDPRRRIYLPTPNEIRKALDQKSAALAVAEAENERLRREIDALRLRHEDEVLSRAWLLRETPIRSGFPPMLPKITETILEAKAAKGLTFADLGGIVGCNPVFLAAVCYRQASATREQAEQLIEALGLDPACLPELTAFPVKGGLMPMVPVNPLLYRFYEIMQVYGLPLKDVIQETFGDGIMSAIDFTLDVEKEADPKGDRVKITLSGKFLPYKRW